MQCHRTVRAGWTACEASRPETVAAAAGAVGQGRLTVSQVEHQMPTTVAEGSSTRARSRRSKGIKFRMPRMADPV